MKKASRHVLTRSADSRGEALKPDTLSSAELEKVIDGPVSGRIPIGLGLRRLKGEQSFASVFVSELTGV